jgi:hypothetical protein
MLEQIIKQRDLNNKTNSELEEMFANIKKKIQSKNYDTLFPIFRAQIEQKID